MDCGQIFAGNFSCVLKERVRVGKFFGPKFLGLRKGEVRWKFLTCPQERVLTEFFEVPQEEVFEVGVVVGEVVVVVVVDVHVGDVGECSRRCRGCSRW